MLIRVEFRFFVLFEAHWLLNDQKSNKKYLNGVTTTLYSQRNCFGTDIRALGTLEMASKHAKCLHFLALMQINYFIFGQFEIMLF